VKPETKRAKPAVAKPAPVAAAKPAAKAASTAPRKAVPMKDDEVEAVVYLKCREGSTDKFYELKRNGCAVSVCYGRRGATGNLSVKEFGSVKEAEKFMNKTALEKRRKGYNDALPREGGDNDDNDKQEESADPLADLETGKKVFVKGGSKLPYTLKKFNGGYSCTCLGFTMNIKNKVI
jgi:predicted DNA-binding WGR domain protein